jgi:zinc transporter ZupT
MAMTAGLLAFVAVDAFAEALDIQARLPGALGGLGTILLGMALSYFGMSIVQHRLSHKRSTEASLSPLVLATMVAVGIGMHNLGEGLAIGSSFALGSLSLGVFLVVGFMIHNITEGLGIAVPASASGNKVRPLRLLTLTLIAGGPAIIGVLLGRYIVNDLVGVLFFAMAVGAALHVIVEVVRQVRAMTPGTSAVTSWTAGGFIAGITVMYLTGVLVG